MVKFAGISHDEVVIWEYVMNEGVENWIKLPNANLQTIYNNMEKETFIQSHASFEPYYTVRITRKKITIEYSWIKDDRKVLSLSKQDVRRIHDSLGEAGKLIRLD